MQELFSQTYFCQQQSGGWFGCAEPLESSEVVAWAARLAKELQVVLPTSFFEKKGAAHYNSIAMIDADGSIMGVYRKSQCLYFLVNSRTLGAPKWLAHHPITVRRVRSQAASFMLTCAHSTRPHPGRPRLPRKVLLQPGRHGLQSMGHNGRQGWRCHLLGPMVPRSGSFFFARVSASLSARTMICCSNLIYADCEAALTCACMHLR